MLSKKAFFYEIDKSRIISKSNLFISQKQLKLTTN